MSAVCCASWRHGFTSRTVRVDRDVISSGKKKGGGIALYVSERWCNSGHVHVKERLRTPDIELLTVGMRPYYLPREFTSAIIITVYVPPSADAAVACNVIHSAVAQMQTQHPNVITGEFNHTSLDKTLPTHWIFCMQMLRMHTVPQPSPPWKI